MKIKMSNANSNALKSIKKIVSPPIFVQVVSRYKGRINRIEQTVKIIADEAVTINTV